MQKKYVKKGETLQEENKTDSPRKENTEGQSYRGGRGTRGGRGGRGGRDNYRSDRPYTTGERRDYKPHYQKKGDNQGEDGENKGYKNRDDRFKNERDENSWYYKYYYAPRPVVEKNVKVTMETEIPPIIPREQRKKNPDQQEYDKQMKTFSN